MDNSLLGLIGLALKAGKTVVGEDAVADAALAHKARLILLASDAAEGTRAKGERLGETGNCPALTLPFTKAELGGAVGRKTCAVAALTDVGFAAAAVKKLAAEDPRQYGGAAERLAYKAEKTQRRRKAQRAIEKEREAKGRKPWAPPTKK